MIRDLFNSTYVKLNSALSQNISCQLLYLILAVFKNCWFTNLFNFMLRVLGHFPGHWAHLLLVAFKRAFSLQTEGEGYFSKVKCNCFFFPCRHFSLELLQMLLLQQQHLLRVCITSSLGQLHLIFNCIL